ncbi:MAG TPA: signal peptidase I [Actinomycetota bacterium]|nr:signal peptidase I [Actinomycetota bacterium]
MPEKHVPKHRAPKRELFGRRSSPSRSSNGSSAAASEDLLSRTVSIVDAPQRPADRPAAAKPATEAPAPADPRPARKPSAGDTLFSPESPPVPRSSEDYFDFLAASRQAPAAPKPPPAPAAAPKPAVHRTEEFVLPEPAQKSNGSAVSANGTNRATDASPLSIKSAIKADGNSWDPFLKDPEPEPGRRFSLSRSSSDMDKVKTRKRARPIQPVRPDERHDHQSLGQWLKEILILGLIAILTAVLLTNYVVQAFFIPSESMEDTLLINDRVLVNKVVYRLRDPKPGDIVVFTSPDRAAVAEDDKGPFANALEEAAQGLGLRSSVQDLIKRVVAVEGQTVEVKIGSLFVDGKQVDEPYRKDFLPMPNFGPVTVPPGQVFVMGDNRGESHDSRAFGPVDKDTIVGRAFALIWPLQRFDWLSS